MNRRKVIQNLTLGVGGLLSLPLWANQPSPFNEETLLAEIVETIIPTTDTKGAKELGVHQFVQRMIKDCSTQKEQENFDVLLKKIEDSSQKKYNKSFITASLSERTAILKEFQSSTEKDLKSSFAQLKRLTISGYTNSEYVMTNLTHFEFAPARFHGCVKAK